jgi:hypothetical protein
MVIRPTVTRNGQVDFNHFDWQHRDFTLESTVRSDPVQLKNPKPLSFGEN